MDEIVSYHITSYFALSHYKPAKYQNTPWQEYVSFAKAKTKEDTAWRYYRPTNAAAFFLGGLFSTFFVWWLFILSDPSHFIDSLTLYAQQWYMSPLLFGVIQSLWNQSAASAIQFWAVVITLLVILHEHVALKESLFWPLWSFSYFHPPFFLGIFYGFCHSFHLSGKKNPFVFS